MKSIHASCQGHAGLERLTAQLDLPKPVKKLYIQKDRKRFQKQ